MGENLVNCSKPLNSHNRHLSYVTMVTEKEIFEI